MSVFGPSKEKLVQLLHQAEALISRFQGEAQHWGEVARALGNENASLQGRLNRAMELRDKTTRRVGELEAEIERLREEVTDLHEEVQDARDDATRAETQLQEATTAWERKQEILDERVNRGLSTEDELRGEASELRRERRALELRVAELEGALGSSGASGRHKPTGTSSSHGARTLQQQAVLARLAKTNMSYDARQRTLRAAKRLGVLPPDLDWELDDEDEV